MSVTHRIICYPVGNGDTTQIVLSSGRRILLDFCHREKAEDKDSPEIDLKARIKRELADAGRDSFDVVAFTHADIDHIGGSTEFFELWHANKYQGKDRVKIEELWLPAAMLLETADKDHQQDEFVLLRQEGRHRLVEGKGVLVFSRPKELMDWLVPKLKDRGEPANARDHLFVDAGTVTPGFTLAQDKVEFFCHSPFVKHVNGKNIIRNSAALAFNIRLRADAAHYDYLHIGDADWEDLEDIVSITRFHNNESRLSWNLYNVPHHCSYRALSDEKGEKITTPKPLVEYLLLKGESNAYVVSSSKPMPDIKESYSAIQPPHIQARKAYEHYLEEVNGRKLLVTMEEPNANKPEPLVFEITGGGVTWKRAAVGAPAIIRTTSPRVG